MFNHERLHCYRRLKEVAGLLFRSSARWPRGNAYLVDQLKRALCSALLNLVEGNQRRSTKERKRFFEISRASISEVAGVIDLAHLLEFISDQEQNILKSELLEILKMISGLS